MKHKLLPLLLVCVLLVSLLSGCVSVSTELSVDSSFKGERVMTLTFDSTCSGQISPTVEDISTKLDAIIPPQLTYDASIADSGVATVNVTLAFESFEDYKSKVAALLNREPEIEYSLQSDAFASKLTLTEDFTSVDLLSWVTGEISATDLTDLSGADLSEFFDKDDFWAQTGVKLTVNGISYDGDGEAISFADLTESYVKSINFKTIIDEDGRFDRSIEFKLATTLTEEQLGVINAYFEKHLPTTATYSQVSESGVSSCIINFTADTAEQLAEYTGIVLNDADAEAVIDSYSDEALPLSMLEAFEESFSLSHFGYGEAVNYSYQLASASGLPSFLYDISSSEPEALSPVKSGNSIYYSPDEPDDTVELRTVLERISTAESIDYNLVINSAKSFTREIKILMAEGTSDEVLEQIKQYYDEKNAEHTTITTVSSNKSPYVRIVITGSGSEVCAAEDTLFGSANNRYLSYSRERGLFRVHPDTEIIDNFDISSLLTVTNASGYVYTVIADASKYDTICDVSVGDADNLPLAEYEANGICMALGSEDGAMNVSIAGNYINAAAIIIVVLIAILFILLLALIVSIYLRSNEDEEEEKTKELEAAPEQPAIAEAKTETPALRDLSALATPPEEENTPADTQEAKPIMWYHDSTPPIVDEPVSEAEPAVEAEPALELEIEDKPAEEAEPEIVLDLDAPIAMPAPDAEPELPTEPEPVVEPEPEPVAESEPTPVFVAEPEIRVEQSEDRFPFEGLPPIIESPYNTVDEGYTNKDFADDLKYLGHYDSYVHRGDKVKVKVKVKRKK